MPASLNIVLVEDNIAFRDEMAIFLARQGWAVSGVDCGEALSEMLQTETPDLVILDINLPHEDGYSIAHRLRESFPEIGIVMLTARSRTHDRADGYKAGADIYLSKPVNPDELIAVVNNLARRIHRTMVASYQLDRTALNLISPTQSMCKLSAIECALLEVLILSPQRRAHREYLLDQLSLKTSRSMTAEALMVVLSRLRAKCQQQLQLDQLVAADRGVGYRLLVPVTLCHRQCKNDPLAPT